MGVGCAFTGYTNALLFLQPRSVYSENAKSGVNVNHATTFDFLKGHIQ